MDRVHLESGYRLHQDQPRLQELLCGANGEAFARYGAAKLRERFQAHCSATHARATPKVEKAEDYLRKLDE